MTCKTRQEVFRAVADWMDVCEKAGVKARYKFTGEIGLCSDTSFKGNPEGYEFPLALLEGKEVWVGSELWHEHLGKVKVRGTSGTFLKITTSDGDCKGSAYNPNSFSWNPPKPATVMVEIPLATAEWYAANKYAEAYQPYFVSEACKKALESLK